MGSVLALPGSTLPHTLLPHWLPAQRRVGLRTGPLASGQVLSSLQMR